MAFLYGDGTRSNLESNYIEFLRKVLDLAVDILVAEHRVRQCRDGGASRRKQAEADLERLKQLSQKVTAALDESTEGPPDSTANRCVANIRLAASNAVKKAADHVKAGLADELRRVTAGMQRERSANLFTLERLLRTHDLPDSTHLVTVSLKGGQGYVARLRGRSGVKVDWVMELDIPEGHIFASPLRVESLVANLEIKVPEKSGLMRKSMKLRSQKLSGKYITEYDQGAQETMIKLREAPDENEAGYDLVISKSTPRVRLSRIARGGETLAPFEPLEEDCAKFLELHGSLASACSELLFSRRSLLEAHLDGKPLAEHDDPSVIVSRLVEHMAPTVQEISRHSLSPSELVLKRVLGDDRREEIFASKTDLLDKLEPVPLELRGVFAPLGLGDLSRGASGSFRAAPTMIAEVSSTEVTDPNVAPTGFLVGELDPDEEKTAVAPKPKVIVNDQDATVQKSPDEILKSGSGHKAESLDAALAELESDK